MAGMFRLQVDTDPENMLPSDHPVRVRNEDFANTFGNGDLLVVGLTAADDVLSPGRGIDPSGRRCRSTSAAI
jgi:predicted RND superfamily exporter protein